MIPFILVAAAICALPISPSGRIMAHTRRRLHPVVIPLVVALMVPAILATDRSTLLISACMTGVVALRAVTAARARKAHENALAATSTFLGHVVAAVRAGSGMPDACTRAVEQLPANTPADLTKELRRAAALCQGSGHGARALTSSDMVELREVGNVWALSSQLGIPAADLLSSARTRIDHALRHRNATKAALAGPRATAAILSVLPLVGVLMGEAMGARPMALLTSGGLGGLLLVIGTALVCAGFITSQAIIRRAAG